jgi:hypothetical protein
MPVALVYSAEACSRSHNQAIYPPGNVDVCHCEWCRISDNNENLGNGTVNRPQIFFRLHCFFMKSCTRIIN